MQNNVTTLTLISLVLIIEIVLVVSLNSSELGVTLDDDSGNVFGGVDASVLNESISGTDIESNPLSFIRVLKTLYGFGINDTSTMPFIIAFVISLFNWLLSLWLIITIYLLLHPTK